MTTLFDRYLLSRYVHSYVLTFGAVLGLYVVIDAFTNLDEFFKGNRAARFEVNKADSGTRLHVIQGAKTTVLDVDLSDFPVAVPAIDFKVPHSLMCILEMIRYYVVRTTDFFNKIGSIVAIVSAMLVLAVVQRHGELNPILSAGIPSYRLVLPIIWGTIAIDSMLVLNQEIVIPAVAHELQLRAGADATSKDSIRPAEDNSSQITIFAGTLYPKTRILADAEFLLPSPEMVLESTQIRAREAVFRPAGKERPLAGWVLRGVNVQFHELSLTRNGSEKVFEGENPKEIFIATDISYDQLVEGNTFNEYLSTAELLRRVKNPAFNSSSVRGQSLHLHSRFTRLLMNVIVVLLIVPLIVRKESRGLIASLATSLVMIMLSLVVEQGFQYLGSEHLLRLDLAAWGPVIVFGTLSAWLSGLVRT